MTQDVRCWLCKGSGAGLRVVHIECQSLAEEQCNLTILIVFAHETLSFRRSSPFWIIFMRYVFHKSENPESILCLEPFVSSVIEVSRLIILECPRGPPQSLFEVQIAVLFCLGVAELLWHVWLCRTKCTIKKTQGSTNSQGNSTTRWTFRQHTLRSCVPKQGEITTSFGHNFVCYRKLHKITWFGRI